MINFEQHYEKASVIKIYAGHQYYQVYGSDYSSAGCILEVSPEDSKCWLLDVTKLGFHVALKECLIAGILCNNSYLKNEQGHWIVVGNSLEGASIAAANKVQICQSSFQNLMPKLDSISFKLKFPYMATLHSNIDKKTIYIKGTPDAILTRTQKMLDKNGNLIDLDFELIVFQIKLMLEEGLKILAFATKQVSEKTNSLELVDLEGEFVFLGLQALLTI